MRPQLLRLLQRVPAGFASQEGLQAVRAGFSTSETSALFSSLQGRKEDGQVFKSFAFAKPNPAGLSFAAHLSSLSSSNDEKQEAGPAAAIREVPKMNASLMALPARTGPNAPPPGMRLAQAYATAAAHGHDDHHDHMTAKEVYMEHTAKRHPFHVMPPSPWPLLAAWGAGTGCLGMSSWFHAVPGGAELMFFSIANIVWSATSWWRDIIIEGDMGMHTEIVKKNLISGMWLFIVSEAMLFFGLLWSCIHLGLSPSVAVQMQWPPVGVIPVGWDKRALVMSVVLAASYYSANVAMVAKDPKMTMAALATTIGLGAMFLYDQYIEYNELPFTITDSGYGTTFFITTGFHGMHVLLGAIYLAAVLGMYARTHKAGVALKLSVLYWHFVDIVWIAVYGIIYVGQY